jgi:hypothetical protein
MTDQQHDAQPQAATPVRPFIYGAVPALIGTVLVLIHLREPIVPHQYQAVLMNFWLACVCSTLAWWLFCALRQVADRICGAFETRHDDVIKELIKIRQGQAHACRRLAKIENQGRALGEAFVEEGVPHNGHQQGPRRLS